FPATGIASRSMSVTTGITRALGSRFGSAVMSPPMSVSSTSRSAPTSAATSAERLSLSPYRISATATVSFSLTTGTAPRATSAHAPRDQPAGRLGEEAAADLHHEPLGSQGFFFEVGFGVALAAVGFALAAGAGVGDTAGCALSGATIGFTSPAVIEQISLSRSY